MVGTGAVGSYYGARLEQGGHDVHFYMRSSVHYETARRDGLTVHSVAGDMHIAPDRLQVYDSTERMAAATASPVASSSFDWILVALKSSALEAIPALIHPLLSPTTRVLVIMNGMIEEDLVAALRAHTTGQQQQTNNNNSTYADNDEAAPLACCQTLYGGMALICCNRVAPAVTNHTYFGLLTAGVASTHHPPTAGEDGADVDVDERAFCDLFAAAAPAVDVSYEPSLRRGRWKKMLWNLPFNGLSVALGGWTVDRIVQDPGLRQLAYDIMDETMAAANAELALAYNGTENFAPLGILDRQAMMKLSDDMGPYRPSTMLDFLQRRPMEVRYLFREPLDRARALGVPTPHLETVVRLVEAQQRRYDLY